MHKQSHQPYPSARAHPCSSSSSSSSSGVNICTFALVKQATSRMQAPAPTPAAGTFYFATLLLLCYFTTVTLLLYFYFATFALLLYLRQALFPYYFTFTFATPSARTHPLLCCFTTRTYYFTTLLNRLGSPGTTSPSKPIPVLY